MKAQLFIRRIGLWRHTTCQKLRPPAGQGPKMLTLGVALALMLATVASAQTYRVLKTFTGRDGYWPLTGLVMASNTLYGTTLGGGSSYNPPDTGYGVVFKINTDGSGYSVLKEFNGSDGSGPIVSLILLGDSLYGVTEYGGTLNNGVVFKINTDGSGYTVLKEFNGTDGAKGTGLVLVGSTLYGTTFNGGHHVIPPRYAGCGVIFKLNTDGSGYTVLKYLEGTDGANPYGALVLRGTTFYGLTDWGGTPRFGMTNWDGNLELGSGVIFKLNTDGSGYTMLTNGLQYPNELCVPAGTTLYGTAESGGIFKVNTDGSGFTWLGAPHAPQDGNASGGLVLAGGITFYGTTGRGASPQYGTVFKVNTDGSGYRVLKRFNFNDGSGPGADLLLVGTTLYGTTTGGGVQDGRLGLGVIFSLECLSITRQPSTQTAETGTTLRLLVDAESLVPGLAYQWFFDGTNALAAATNAFLQLTNVQPVQAGTYTVMVTSMGLAMTSAPAMLSVIPPVPRRTVPALTLMGQTESVLNLDSRTFLGSSASWETFDTVPLTNTPQLYFDLATPFAPQRFYRAWQTNVLSRPSVRDVRLVPAINLTGTIGSSVRVDYINQFGPTDAWVTLDTVTLSNATQLYFDTTAFGQPTRLYRLVTLP